MSSRIVPITIAVLIAVIGWLVFCIPTSYIPGFPGFILNISFKAIGIALMVCGVGVFIQAFYSQKAKRG
jgi:hypothetical protein